MRFSFAANSKDRTMLKTLAEGIAHVRIYRNEHLPWGLDFPADVAQRAPEVHFRNVFDVGANVGQSALRFKECFPSATISSYEPFEEAFRKLEGATRGLNVRCHKLAMGAEPGKAAVALASLTVNNSVLERARESQRRLRGNGRAGHA